MPVQVARQAAAREALLCAEQLAALQGRAVTITLPSATTARDLSPSRPASRTTHRNVARNNLYDSNVAPRAVRRVDCGGAVATPAPSRVGRDLQHFYNGPGGGGRRGRWPFVVACKIKSTYYK